MTSVICEILLGCWRIVFLQDHLYLSRIAGIVSSVPHVSWAGELGVYALRRIVLGPIILTVSRSHGL